MADQQDAVFMPHAIARAKAGATAGGGGPTGGAIAVSGRVVGEEHNKAPLRCDETAHAEIVAIRRVAA